MKTCLIVIVTIYFGFMNALQGQIRAVNKSGIPGAEGKRWAMLVGIDQYPGWDSRNSENNTIYHQKLISILTSQYGYQPDHILTLFNQDATSRNLYRTNDRLMKEMGPDDSFFIYFSARWMQQDNQPKVVSKREVAPNSPLPGETVYFLPVDAIEKEAYTWMDLEDLFASLFRLPMKSIFVAIDECLVLPERYKKQFISRCAEKKLQGGFLLSYSCKNQWSLDPFSNSLSETFIDQLNSSRLAERNTLSAFTLAIRLEQALSFFNVVVNELEYEKGFVFYTARGHIDPTLIRELNESQPVQVRIKAVQDLVRFVQGAEQSTRQKITDEAISSYLGPIVTQAAEVSGHISTEQEVLGLKLRALESIVQLDEQRGLQYIEKVLSGKDKAELQSGAFSLLRKYPKESALPLYRKTLQNPHPELRINAIRTLALVPDMSSRGTIVDMAIGDEAENVRMVSIEVLPQFVPLSESELESIKALLEEKHPDAIRKSAMNTLSQMRASGVTLQIAEVLISASGTALKESGAYALATLYDSLQTELNAKIEKILLQALQTESDPGVREAIVSALGNYGGDQIEGHLIRIIKDLRGEDNTVRTTAIYALQKTGGSRTARNILIDLVSDADPQIRLAAIKTLGVIGDEKALEALYGVIKDDNLHVREAAQQSIDRIYDAQVLGQQLEYIKRDLADSFYSVRLDALHKLNALKISDTYLLAIPLMEDHDYSVRETAIQILSQARDANTLKALSSSLLNVQYPERFLLRSGAARVLGNIGDKSAIADLFLALQDPNSNVRARVTEAMGKMMEARVIDTLFRIIRDYDPEVRKAAAEALAHQCLQRVKNGLNKEAVELAEQCYAQLKQNLGGSDIWARWFDVFATRQSGQVSLLGMEVFSAEDLAQDQPVFIRLYDGDPFTCLLYNRTKEDLFISVFDLAGNGQISMVQSAFIDPEDSLRIPLRAFLPKGEGHEMDVFKVFATRFRVDFQQLLEVSADDKRGTLPDRFRERIRAALLARSKDPDEADRWETIESLLEVVARPMANKEMLKK